MSCDSLQDEDITGLKYGGTNMTTPIPSNKLKAETFQLQEEQK